MNAPRGFITNCNANDTDRLVTRAKNGLRSNAVKPVDYDALRAVLNEKRFSGQASLLKVKEIIETSKQHKEQNLCRQHRFIWLKEHASLAASSARLHAELEALVSANLADEATGPLYAEIDACSGRLADQWLEFKQATADTFLKLRRDVRALSEAVVRDAAARTTLEEEVSAMKSVIESLQRHESQELDRLRAVQRELEAELSIDGLVDYSSPPERHVQTGIPEEAFNLECPDVTWKASVLEEFILLDGRFVEKLNALESQHADVLGRRNGGWTGQDHSLFLYLEQQYAQHALQDRRALLLDVLRKHLPHKSRQDIVEHEAWCSRCTFYASRRRDVLSDWTRDRAELFNQVTLTFREACAAQEQQEARADFLHAQRDLCEQLYSKVREWRQKKEEAQRLEQNLSALRCREEEEARAQGERAERARREDAKKRIERFKGGQEERRHQQAERDRLRLDELQRELEEQATLDRERIKYRDDERKKKKEEQQKRLEAQDAAEDEKERILEQIRKKVRPHVEGDLLRLWSDTVAWQQRQKPDEYVSIQRPLFDINSFTSKQIVADPRFRLEQRLRDAGLNNTTYARQAMTQIKPLHAPRRDQESTLFK